MCSQHCFSVNFTLEIFNVNVFSALFLTVWTNSYCSSHLHCWQLGPWAGTSISCPVYEASYLYILIPVWVIHTIVWILFCIFSFNIVWLWLKISIETIYSFEGCQSVCTAASTCELSLQTVFWQIMAKIAWKNTWIEIEVESCRK